MEKIHRKYKIVAFIPLRGGSKSIPLKNIREMAGKPLAYWVIKAALNCFSIDKVIVSTDSDLIKSKVEEIENKKLEIIGRSKKTATDTAPTESAMIEFAKNNVFDYIILIQATSPLLESFYLEQGIRKYFKNKCDSLLSIVRQKRFIWKEKEKLVKPVNYSPSKRPRRQKFEGFLVENGAFYITSRERLLKTGCRISGRICSYEMPEETYFEIDNPSDWIIVENLLEAKKKEELKEKAKKIKFFITDVDGVLTDGGMYYSEKGEVFKKFNTRDGMGIELLRKQGITPVLITKEKSKIILRRAEKLKVKEVYIGAKDKLKIIKKLIKKYNLKFDEVAYIGDDVNDLPVLEKMGLSFAPSDAIGEVKKKVNYVVKRCGGNGALREAIDFLITYKKRKK